MGGQSRPSLARLSPLHCLSQLPATADCIEMREPPRWPLEPQPLNMLSRPNLFPCSLMELQQSQQGLSVLEATGGAGGREGGSPWFCCKTPAPCVTQHCPPQGGQLREESLS